MKKILWIFAFIGICFIGDRILGAGLKGIMSKSLFRYARMYKGGIQTDVLVVGNSRGVNSFYQPDMEVALNKEIFNISYNGLRMDIAMVLITDYLELNPPPKTIILEASVLSKAYPELIKEFKPFATPGTNLEKKLSELYPRVALFSRISTLFSLNSELFLRSLYYLDRSDQSWINNGVIDQGAIDMLEDYKGSYFETTSELIDQVEQLNLLCQQRNIDLKILLCPYLPQYANKINNLDEWLNLINSSLSNNEIINHSSIIQDPKSFADWVHLNKLGSKNYLQYLLTNHILN